MEKYVLLFLSLILFTGAKVLPKDENACKSLLGNDLIEEIASYADVKDQILDYVLEGDFKGKTYDELAKFIDTFGARPSGSQVLENSIDYMINLTQQENLHDITTEELEVPQWNRGHESVKMLHPREKDMSVLGLGKNANTPPDGITAEVVVIHDFDSLESTPTEDVVGKIVLFVPIFTTYSETVPYRSQGAAKAAAKGAVACLVRSITPFSINSPHAGSQNYDDNVPKIPAAAITLEDADLITRLYERGENVILNITMQSFLNTSISRNTIIDLKGREDPDKVVIVSGHIDSWDVGEGAMDDGGGIFISWAAPVILNRLNLKPRRTIRTIFWTAEELGLVGAVAYNEKHRKEIANINFIMESDIGTFAPLGLEVAGTQTTQCIIGEILKLFKSINASTLVESDKVGSDIQVIAAEGVPSGSLYNANDRYFWFHHTKGDTMNVENPEELDLGSAFWTAVAYIIADLSIDMPR